MAKFIAADRLCNHVIDSSLFAFKLRIDLYLPPTVITRQLAFLPQLLGQELFARLCPTAILQLIVEALKKYKISVTANVHVFHEDCVFHLCPEIVAVDYNPS
jgi:hypothetical protein